MVWMTVFQSPAGVMIGFSLLTTASRTALGTTKRPIQWAVEALMQG